MGPQSGPLPSLKGSEVYRCFVGLAAIGGQKLRVKFQRKSLLARPNSEPKGQGSAMEVPCRHC